MEEEKKGRVLIDCGFTKLNNPYWKETAGTERYVRNAAVWLLALDYRMKIGAPLRGSIHQTNEENNNNEKEVEKVQEKSMETEVTTPPVVIPETAS
jgi:hypothetical protein